MDEEPNLANPDFLPNGFAGITLKNHTVIPPMRKKTETQYLTYNKKNK